MLEIVAIVVGSILWQVYVTVLCKLFRQSWRADLLASLIGQVAVVLAAAAYR
jgi:hypothetical protein